MLKLGFILALIGISGCVFWIIGLKKLFGKKKPQIKKENFENVYVESHSGLTSFSKETTYEKGTQYSVQHKVGMTYSEIENGLKKKDPDIITFIQIFAGFFFFWMGTISSIGSFVVAYGNSEGWYMIGLCIVFFIIFTYIVISQKLDSKRKQKEESFES